MIFRLLRRFGLHIERRNPPPGVEAVDHFGDIGAIFDMDAARQAARYDAAQQALRRHTLDVRVVLPLGLQPFKSLLNCLRRSGLQIRNYWMTLRKIAKAPGENAFVRKKQFVRERWAVG
jgi:hypothetical protein